MFLSFGILTLASCGKRQDLSQPLALLFTGDTAGRIVPCGCTSYQAGGLSRRARVISKIRQQRAVLLVDVGGAPAGTSDYQREKFEAILRGELAMSVDAHNLGAAEAALGSDYLQEVAQRIQVPLVSTNLRDASGTPIAPSHRVVTVAGRRIIVLGVLSPSLAPPGMVAQPPQQAVLQTLAELDSNYDLSLVLAYLPEEELRAFAQQLPEVDLVMGGPTGQSMPAQRYGPTTVAAVTNLGKYLARFDVTPEGLDPCQFLELGPKIADHPTQQQNLSDFYERLRRADFRADRTQLRKSAFQVAQTDAFVYAGTSACRECHDQDCSLWDDSAHSHAWKTLVDKKSEVDPYCQQCHTTGYGEPGGFISIRQSPDRLNVGCESCHGPSQAHVADPSEPTPFTSSDQCVTCHDQENSPEFDYDTYWQTIDHGLPASSADPTRGVSPVENREESR